MAIIGVFTDIGVLKARQAQNDEGFKIFPTNFGVSRTAGVIEGSRTGPNAGNWFTGPISSRVVIDDNTLKFICTIPAGSIPPNTIDTVREIYLYGTDDSLVDFLFAVGQPSTPLTYDPTGSLTLELELSLTNVDLTSAIVFQYTQATELSEHNLDPCAHSGILLEMKRAGMFVDSGCFSQAYAGQMYDKFVDFDGTKAFGTHIGVTYTAQYTGVLGNSISLVFDGIKTTDDVRAVWNAANPNNQVEHNGTGSEVLAAGTLNLSGGTTAVADRAFVYLDTDGVYKEALADGSLKSKVAGIAYLLDRVVKTGSYHAIDTLSIAEGTTIYLEDTIGQEGKFTITPTTVQLGFVMADGLILFGSQGGGGSGGGSGTNVGFDAVVSDTAGVNFYPTTQQAVDAVSDGGRILVDKLEYVDAEIDLTGKRLDIFFNGPEAGWSRFQGTAEVQKITFSGVPTSGTWRIEWNSQFTVDLAYNCTAIAIQNAINALTGTGLPVSVSGNFTLGFTITYTTLVDVPEPTFLHPGTNEIQRVTFGNVPTNGTIRFNLDGNDTANLAWNDDSLLFETYIEDLPNVDSVTVTGSFASEQFDIEFTGVDGKQPKNQFTIVANTLSNPSATSAVMSTVQQGIYPASNLKIGGSPITIMVATLQGGSPIGPTAAVLVGKDYTRFIGLGKIENFDQGFDLNGKVGTDIEMLFSGVDLPFDNSGLTPVKDYHTEKSFGLSSRRDRVVGPFGDHETLWDAVSEANNGDRILVTEDQSIYSNQDINKDIEIVFLNGKQINVTGFVAGNVLSLGTKVRTRYMRMSVADAGSLPVVVANQTSHLSTTTNAPGSPYIPIAQSFTVAAGIDIDAVDLYLQKFGLPVANLTVEIRADNAGNPGSLMGTSDIVAASSVNSGSGAVKTFGFSTPVTVGAGSYWLVLRVSSITTFDVSNRLLIYYTSGSYGGGVAKQDTANSNVWTAFGAGADLYFEVRGINVNNFDTMYKLYGTRGNHQDLTLECSGVTTIIDKAFKVDFGATAIFTDGVILRNSATVNTVLSNDSGYVSHNIIIRDRDGGLVYDVQARQTPKQETPTGVVDGVNDIFTLSSAVLSANGLLVMVDGIPRTKTTAWSLISPTQFQFQAGYVPKLGQPVEVFYLPGGVANTPPRHLTALNNGLDILTQVKDINFGNALVVSPDGPGRVKVDVAAGGGLGTFQQVFYTLTPTDITNKNFTFGPAPLVPAKVVVDVLQLGAKQITVDFTITGTTFAWTGLGLDGIMLSGMTVRLVYFS